MFSRTPALLALLWLAAPASAEGRADTFLDLISQVPTDSTKGPAASMGANTIYFADHDAARDSLDPLPSGTDPEVVETYGPFARLLSTDFASSFVQGRGGDWHPLVGFGPDDVQAHLLVERPPSRGRVLLLDPGLAEGVAPALLSSGYSEASQDGVTALARGEDNALGDGTGRADPFGSGGSRVAVEGDLLVQANAWPLFLGLSGARTQGHPGFPALGAVLDAPDWGDAALVQAQVWVSPEQVVTLAGGGIPRWSMAAMADLDAGAKALTLVLFVYRDRADAEAAAARLMDGWAETPRLGDALATATGVTDPDVQVLGDGPFVTTLILRSPTAAVRGWPVNAAYYGLNQAWVQGGLSLFGPP